MLTGLIRGLQAAHPDTTTALLSRKAGDAHHGPVKMHASFVVLGWAGAWPLLCCVALLPCCLDSVVMPPQAPMEPQWHCMRHACRHEVGCLIGHDCCSTASRAVPCTRLHCSTALLHLCTEPLLIRTETWVHYFFCERAQLCLWPQVIIQAVTQCMYCCIDAMLVLSKPCWCCWYIIKSLAVIRESLGGGTVLYGGGGNV